MQKYFVTAFAATLLMAAPAFAQSSSSSSSTAQQSNKTPLTPAQVEQNLHQDLTKAGYTDINIAPGSFVIHAKDSKGEPTEMVITPSSLTTVTAVPKSDEKSSSK